MTHNNPDGINAFTHFEITCKLCKTAFKKTGAAERDIFMELPCPICHVWPGNMLPKIYGKIDAVITTTPDAEQSR